MKALPRGKPSGLPFHARFTDIAGQAGLHAPVVYGGVGRNDYILESMGCGIAFFDYDNDGWLDILALSGSRLDGTAAGATNRLYKNNRDGTFTDVTEKAGLVRGGWACGVTIGDYDNDGFEDVFITYWGQNVLYRNNGDGTFRDVTKEAGLLQDGPARWSTGCTWVDYDRDGQLDLFVSRYLVFDPKVVPRHRPESQLQLEGYPRELRTTRTAAETVHPLSQQRRRYVHRCIAKSGHRSHDAGYGLTAVAADFDDDGWPDIYVACDSTPSLLFRNNHDGTFTEEGLERGVALNEDGQEQAGMGLGIGDFNLRRPPGYFEDALHRGHGGALSQRRQGRLSRRDHSRGARRGDAIRQLGRGHCRPR